MLDAFLTGIEKHRKLVKVFDRLNFSDEALMNLVNGQVKNSYSCSKLPGMTAEYRELCGKLPTGLVPLEDLQELVFKPLKDQYTAKFQGGSQDVEFYSVCFLNGKKMYKKLFGKERDIAVQKDIFEQIKCRKEIEITHQALRLKLHTALQDYLQLRQAVAMQQKFLFSRT